VARAITPASTHHADIGLVMFCVRVTPSLRRRVKLAAVASGRTIQQLAVEALEDVCRHHEP